jgi:hypothetical protein
LDKIFNWREKAPGSKEKERAIPSRRSYARELIFIRSIIYDGVRNVVLITPSGNE